MYHRPIYSFIADSRNRNDGKVAIRIQVFYQNGKTKEQLFIPLKLYYTPEEWALIQDENNRRGDKRIIHGDKLILEREKIAFAKNRIAKIINDYVDKGSIFSIKSIKNDFLNKPADSINRIFLMNLFDELISIKEQTNKSHSTIESYKNAKKSFAFYIDNYLTEKSATFLITSINADWINDYFSKMKLLSPTTKNDYIILLRAIFNHAISAKLIDKELYPFDSKKRDNFYTIHSTKKSKRALTLDEFEKLKSCRKALSAKQQEAWDYFMLSYLFNGANLRDIADLKFSDIDNITNTVTFRRSKTLLSKAHDEDIVVYLSEQIKRIIELRGNPLSPESYIFPIFTGNEQNNIEKTKIVKEKTHSWGRKWNLIAQKAGIRNDLTYQMARHTYATLATLNSVPVEEISKSMGHASIKQTKEYIATLPRNTTPANEKMKQETVPLDIFN